MRPAIYSYLLQTENPSADRALAAALAEVEAAFAEPVVQTILARGAAGADGLIRFFHRLPSAVKNLVVHEVARLREPLHRVGRASDTLGRSNVYRIVAHAKSIELAGLLTVGLRDSAPEVRCAAAEALRELADQYLTTGEQSADETVHDPVGLLAGQLGSASAERGKERKILLAVLQEGLNSLGVHRRPEVIETAMWFAMQLERMLQAHVAAAGDQHIEVIGELLRREPTPRMAAFVCLALGWSRVRQVAADVIAQAKDGLFLRSLLSHKDRFCKPVAQYGLAEVRRLVWLERDPGLIRRLSSDQQVAAMAIISASAIDERLKLLVAQDVLLSGTREAQRIALECLLANGRDETTDTLRQVLAWDDEEFTEAALVELLRRSPPDLPALVIQQLTSRSPRVRQLAAQHAASYSFERYWQAFDDLPPDARVSAGRAVLKLVPDFVDRLVRKLEEGRSDEILRALQAADDLNLLKSLSSTLARLERHHSQSVRAAAARALGKLDKQQQTRAQQAVDEASAAQPQASSEQQASPHAAVSPERVADNKLGELERMLSAPETEARADAVRQLLHTQIVPATAILIDLLTDENVSRRQCGLELIEETRLAAMMAHVLGMARHEPDPSLRQRAQNVADTVRQELQAAIRGHAQFEEQQV
ncbi:MAG TPA: hypothetical protein VMZ31_13640 [Phycisphaerae bacterium]|nr:hypothetical protein [Phycisphaerae bacterium]